jgi:hypothetical protein
LILIHRFFCLKQTSAEHQLYGQELYTWESGFGFGIVSDGGAHLFWDIFRCHFGKGRIRFIPLSKKGIISHDSFYLI